MPSSSRSHASSSNLSAQRVKTRKLGKMPSIQTDQNAEEDRGKHTNLKMSFSGWLTKVNHMKNQISRARLQMMNGSGPENFVGQDYIHQTFSSNPKQASDDLKGFPKDKDDNDTTENREANYPTQNKNSNV